MKLIPKAQSGANIYNSVNLNSGTESKSDNTYVFNQPIYENIDQIRRAAELQKQQEDYERYINTPQLWAADSIEAKNHQKQIADYRRTRAKQLLEQAGPLGGQYIINLYNDKGLEAAQEAANITRGITEAAPRIALSFTTPGLIATSLEGAANSAKLLGGDKDQQAAGQFGLAMAGLPFVGFPLSSISRSVAKSFYLPTEFTAKNGIKIKFGRPFAQNSASGQSMFVGIDGMPDTGVLISPNRNIRGYNLTFRHPQDVNKLTSSQVSALLDAIENTDYIQPGVSITTDNIGDIARLSTLGSMSWDRIFNNKHRIGNDIVPVFAKPERINVAPTSSRIKSTIHSKQEEWPELLDLRSKKRATDRDIYDYIAQGKDDAVANFTNPASVKGYNSDKDYFMSFFDLGQPIEPLENFIKTAEKNGTLPIYTNALKQILDLRKAGDVQKLQQLKEMYFQPRFTYDGQEFWFGGQKIPSPSISLVDNIPSKEGEFINGEFDQIANAINLNKTAAYSDLLGAGKINPRSTLFHEYNHYLRNPYLNGNPFYAAYLRDLMKKDVSKNGLLMPHELPIYLQEAGYNFGLNPGSQYDEATLQQIARELQNSNFKYTLFNNINFAGDDALRQKLWRYMTGQFKKGGKFKKKNI